MKLKKKTLKSLKKIIYMTHKLITRFIQILFEKNKIKIKDLSEKNSELISKKDELTLYNIELEN